MRPCETIRNSNDSVKHRRAPGLDSESDLLALSFDTCLALGVDVARRSMGADGSVGGAD